MRIRTNSSLIVLTLIFGIMMASGISTASVLVFAQNNQTNTATSSGGNQTTTNVTPAGKQATRIINQTSIPANQTTTNATSAAKQPQTAPSPTNQTVGSAASQTLSSGAGGGGGSNQTGAKPQSSNSSSGNSLSKVPVIGNLFGGK